VNVTINAVNDGPVGTDDSGSTTEDTPVTLLSADLLANDNDADGDALSLSSVQGATNGTVEIDGNGNVLFTPDTSFTGDATFTYTLIDGNGGTDTALVTVNVAA
jgi:hypothetical protein